VIQKLKFALFSRDARIMNINALMEDVLRISLTVLGLKRRVK
jgi:hypothetical protein